MTTATRPADTAAALLADLQIQLVEVSAKLGNARALLCRAQLLGSDDLQIKARALVAGLEARAEWLLDMIVDTQILMVKTAA